MRGSTLNTWLLIGVLLLAKGATSQQVYQYSQYLQNMFMVNSATAGMNNYTDVSLSYRKQWVGITNSPSTIYASITSPIGKDIKINAQKSSTRISNPGSYQTAVSRKAFQALGGYILQDSYGPFQSTNFNVAYAFHLPIAEYWTVSFSPNVGLSSVRFDQNKAQLEIEQDNTYANFVSQRNGTTQMDINLAFWLYSESLFLGYSTDQFLQDRLQFTDIVSSNQLKVHHVFSAGYHFPFKTDFLFTPSVLVKYLDQSPLAADVNLRLDYQDRLWAGVSYRFNQTVVAMAGAYISNTIRMGYSFDYALSSLRLQNGGSHEFMIGINLFSKEKAVF